MITFGAMLWETGTLSRHSTTGASPQLPALDGHIRTTKESYRSRATHKQHVGRAASAMGRHAEEADQSQPSALPIERRSWLVTLASAAAACSRPADAEASAEGAGHASQGSQLEPEGSTERLTTPDYTAAGPLSSSAFPNLEHTCSRCFPACVGNRCMLRLGVIFPRDGRSKGRCSTPLQCAMPDVVFFPGCSHAYSLLQRSCDKPTLCKVLSYSSTWKPPMALFRR